MSKLEGLLGFGIFSVAAASGYMFGLTYAKGLNPSQEMFYFLPFIGTAGFVFGARTNHPQGPDVKVGGVYAGATAVIGGIGFAAGYAAEILTGL